MSSYNTTKDTIMALAQKYGITADSHALDGLAAAITSLADDDVDPPDETEILLIRLRQQRHINNVQFDQLLYAYLTEQTHDF